MTCPRPHVAGRSLRSISNARSTRDSVVRDAPAHDAFNAPLRRSPRPFQSDSARGPSRMPRLDRSQVDRPSEQFGRHVVEHTMSRPPARGQDASEPPSESTSSSTNESGRALAMRRGLARRRGGDEPGKIINGTPVMWLSPEQHRVEGPTRWHGSAASAARHTSQHAPPWRGLAGVINARPMPSTRRVNPRRRRDAAGGG